MCFSCDYCETALPGVCEGMAQVIGASRWPLKMLPVLEWEAVE